MKTKNSDIAVKIFLVVVAVILVGLIIAWSTGVFKDKRNDLNEGTEKINKAINSMVEFDLLYYDGGNVTGRLLSKLITDSEMDVSIRVQTLGMPALSSPTPPPVYPTEIPLDKAATNYINPNGIFKGEVVRDPNGVITDIIFTQQ
jgi:hypothetical protein